MMKKLDDFIYPKQKELFEMLRQIYKGQHIYTCKDNYILVQGEAPVMLLAHLDTVHKKPVKQICKTQNGNILMSPQGIGGDDRCGVYALVTAYEQSEIKPWLLFTCDEEVGCVGAQQFCIKHEKNKLPKALDDLKLLIEIDRKGKDDAVYYDCDNAEFEDYITSKGFHTEWGSLSDISYVAPELGVAAVNLSSGYYNAHTLHEYIDRRQLMGTIKKVIDIIADAAKPDFPKYEYVEAVNYDRLCGGFYSKGWYDDFYDNKDAKKIKDVLATVPEEYRHAYEELLDFYSVEELEYYRTEDGDRIIAMMFESEFGMTNRELNKYYDELENDETEDEDEVDEGTVKQKEDDSNE